MNLNPLTLFAKKPMPKPQLESEALVQVAASNLSAQRWETYSDVVTTRRGYDTYVEMLRDPMLQSCDFIKTHAPLLRGYTIACAVEDEDEENYEVAREQADFVEWAFSEMQGDILDVLADVASAYAFGWSICEPVWTLLDRGDFAGYIGLKSIKSKDPQNLSLTTDEFGNLQTVVLTPSLLSSSTQREEWPADRFVIWRNRQRFNSLYGSSDLAAAYNFYAAKKHALKHLAIYLEKQAVPALLGKYVDGATTTTQTELLTQLKKLQSQTAMVIPASATVETVGSDAAVQERFLDSMRYYDQQMAVALLGQTLTSGEGERTGSLALGNVHLQILQMYIESTQTALSQTVVDEQIIRRLIDYNWPEGQRWYPNFKLNALDGKDLAMLADVVYKMTTAGVITPDEPWIRSEFGWPAAPELTPEEIAAQEAMEQAELERRQAEEQGFPRNGETAKPPVQEEGAK